MPPWFVFWPVAVAGGWLTHALGRRWTGDRAVTTWVVVSYAVRVMIALVFFAISYWRLPILTSLQSFPGFWWFAPDTWTYHRFGERIVNSWQLSLEMPDPGLSFEYFAVVAAVYRLLGVYPLYPILLNCLVATLAALCAYDLGLRLGGRPAARWAALLVGFWPSSLMWSALLLKDALTSWFIFAALASAAQLLDGRMVMGLRAQAVAALRLIGGIVGAALIRFYLGWALATASLMTCVSAGVAARRRPAIALRRGLTLAVVVVGVTMAQNLHLRTLLAPRHPDLGHYYLGLRALSDGQGWTAAQEFDSALALNATRKDVWLARATANIHQGDFPEAIEAYQTYRTLEPDPVKQAGLRRLVEQVQALWVPLQRARLEGRHATIIDTAFDEAMAIFTEYVPAERRRLPMPQRLLGRLDQFLKSLQSPSDEPAVVAQMRHVLEQLTLPSGEQVAGQIRAAAQMMSPESLDSMRQGSVSTGGNALMDARVDLSNSWKLLRYLPRALTIGFLSPFPNQWFNRRGSTGVMRMLASAEMLLIYLLLPAMLLGAWRLVRQRSAVGLLLLAYIVCTAIPMCLVVANIGSLFRLRLQFLLPCVVVAAVAGPAQVYRLAVDWLAQRCSALAARTVEE